MSGATRFFALLAACAWILAHAPTSAAECRLGRAVGELVRDKKAGVRRVIVRRAGKTVPYFATNRTWPRSGRNFQA